MNADKTEIISKWSAKIRVEISGDQRAIPPKKGDGIMKRRLFILFWIMIFVPDTR